jgi:hypothetical protein
MGLAKLVGKIATHDELVELLEEMEQEQIKLRSAIKWALGENGEFAPPHELASAKQGKYWWRRDLRSRAGM